MKQKKLTRNSFVDGMGAFDIMPSFDVKIKKMSLSTPFNQVAASFSKVGTIMYNVIQAESHHHGGASSTSTIYCTNPSPCDACRL